MTVNIRRQLGRFHVKTNFDPTHHGVCKPERSRGSFPNHTQSSTLGLFMQMLLAPTSALFHIGLWLMLPLLACALRYAPWQQLLTSSARQHLCFGSVLVLALVWLLGVKVSPALAFHPVLMTVTTMLLGWSLALLAGTLALLVMKLLQLAIVTAQMPLDSAWPLLNLYGLPVDFCLNVAVPACWTWAVIAFVNRWSVKNPFTYFLGVGFFGALAVCALIDASAFLLFTLAGAAPQLAALHDYGWAFLLMSFPEGFLNGTLATAFTVFWPDIVKTYRDDWFIPD